ncbi:hypothetical protein [Streptomyces sp. AHA2]|uniref:hypothetical protein n=1 Tax=Streptomyces sp. AHA2 TaxID=3064526 RepID=UPI002FE1AC64
MTSHDDRESSPAGGMRAGQEDRAARSDAGWPRRTEDPAGVPEEGADAVEDEAAVRRAVDDDASTEVFTGQDTEDRGALAPEFREPSHGNE